MNAVHSVHAFQRVTLDSGGDRTRAIEHIARLIAQGVPWDHVEWRVSADDVAPTLEWRVPFSLRHLPASFLDTAATVLLHADEDRFMRIHRMAERLLHNRAHWDDVLHPEHVHLKSLERQVRRDMHKMKAFVRFTRVAGTVADEYVAWFEPHYFIVPVMGIFFRRRFASMRWSILTPHGSLRWDGRQLLNGPPAVKSDAPSPDAGEALWLTYYERIFNPARIKINAMKKEMPVYYWKNLPEAQRIPLLLARAPEQVSKMIEASEPGRRAGMGCKPRADAISQNGLALLNTQLRACLDCDFAMRATQPVGGEGDISARIVIVGEQPGDEEDLMGRPFIGPAGSLLRQALQDLNVNAGSVYITNAVKHFNYDMRGKQRVHKAPTARAVEQCGTWLERELALLNPAVVIALGRTAQRALLRLFAPAVDGAWTTSKGAAIEVLAHPAALLRAGEAHGSAGYLRWLNQWAQVLERQHYETPLHT